MAISRMQMDRQLYEGGGIITLTPRSKYGLGSKLKKFVRKIIPNEVSEIAVKAAPFVAPFNPLLAGAMSGIGSFDQTGSLTKGLTRGALTYGGGQLARYLGGAGFQEGINPFAGADFSGGFLSGIQSLGTSPIGTETGLRLGQYKMFGGTPTQEIVSSGQPPLASEGSIATGIDSSKAYYPTDFATEALPLEQATTGITTAGQTAAQTAAQKATTPGYTDLFKQVLSGDAQQKTQALKQLGGKALKDIYTKPVPGSPGETQIDKLAIGATIAGGMSYLEAKKLAEEAGIVDNADKYTEEMYNADKSRYSNYYSQILTPEAFGITSKADGGRVGFAEGSTLTDLFKRYEDIQTPSGPALDNPDFIPETALGNIERGISDFLKSDRGLKYGKDIPLDINDIYSFIEAQRRSFSPDLSQNYQGGDLYPYLQDFYKYKYGIPRINEYGYFDYPGEDKNEKIFKSYFNQPYQYGLNQTTPTEDLINNLNTTTINTTAQTTPTGLTSVAETLFPQGDFLNIRETAASPTEYNIEATKDLVENLPSVLQPFAPAAAAALSLPYDAIQAYQRMEPDSGIAGFKKAFQAERPLKSAFERFVGASGPLAENINTAISSLNPFQKQQYMNYAVQNPDQAIAAAQRNKDFLAATQKNTNPATPAPASMADGGRVGFAYGTPSQESGIPSITLTKQDNTEVAGLSKNRVAQLMSLLEDPTIDEDYRKQIQDEIRLLMGKKDGGRIGFKDGPTKEGIVSINPMQDDLEELLGPGAGIMAPGLAKIMSKGVPTFTSAEKTLVIRNLAGRGKGTAAYKELGVTIPEAKAIMDNPAANLKDATILKEFIKAIMGKKDGGRMGFMMGSEVPVRQNQAGVSEMDYRNTGGFVPPIGVKEKADDIPAMLSNNEFVFTADAVRAAGGGSVNKGAQKMYSLMKQLEGKVV
jgi:hypothetical protein